MNWRSVVKRVLAPMLVMVMAWSLVSCSQPEGVARKSLISRSAKLAEIAPPAAIQELKQFTDVYQPQVKILSPRSGEVLQDTTVSVKLQVNDLPLFKDEESGLGSHLHFILDNQPYEPIYGVDEPIVLNDLTPGSHTIRVFASRPWHESYKNEGAYDQVTFHLFAKTPDNSPDPAKPLLTYSRPKATYGAEPVLLDFYLRNAPLHFIAQENSTDAIPDWQIRCTVNGESFTFDRWEPIYLQGLKPGKNWIQLELLDENGNPFPNVYNNTVRLITYEPNGTDALSRLTRGEIPMTVARRFIDPNYVPPVPEPEIPESETNEEPTSDTEETLEPIAPAAGNEEAPVLPPTEEPTVEEPIEVQEAPIQIPALEPTAGEPTEKPDDGRVKEELVEEVQEQLQSPEALTPPVLVAPETPQPVEDLAPIAPAKPKLPAQPNPKSKFKEFLSSAKEKAGQVKNQAKDTMGRFRKPAGTNQPTLVSPAAPQVPEVPQTMEAPESVEVEPSILEPSIPQPSAIERSIPEPPKQLPDSSMPKTLPELLDEPTIEAPIPNLPPPASRSPISIPRLLFLHS